MAEMKSFMLSLALFALTAFPAVAEVPTADQVLAPAKAKAAAEHKAIFVHFGASWCVWCKRLDAFLERPDIRPAFERYFVPVIVRSKLNELAENSIFPLVPTR